MSFLDAGRKSYHPENTFDTLVEGEDKEAEIDDGIREGLQLLHDVKNFTSFIQQSPDKIEL